MGAANQLAVHAADKVVRHPAQKYNPLLLQGPSGVGKTHLMHAIGNGLVAAGGGRPIVACVNAQQFVDELIAAIQGAHVDRWRARYRSVDALLIDDVQFVAGKERTQDEFFLLFNALIAGGKQVVLSSDRPPAEVPGLEARLRSRFEGGLVVPMQPPDRELRERLLARFLRSAGREVDAPTLALLGDQPVQSVREIIGVVNRLVAASDVASAPITVQLIRRELGLEVPRGPEPAVPPPEDTRDLLLRDAEKIVFEWPDVGARLIEEFR